MGLRATQCILNEINRIIMDKLAPRPLMFARTDEGRTDGHTKLGGYNIIPHHFLCGGYKNGSVGQVFFFFFQLKNLKVHIGCHYASPT